MPFPELGLSILITFCQGGPYYLGFFLVSPLGPRGWPLSFTKPKVTVENATVGRGGRQKALVQLLLPCTGVKRTVLALSCPQYATILGYPVLQEGQPEAVGRHV